MSMWQGGNGEAFGPISNAGPQGPTGATGSTGASGATPFQNFAVSPLGNGSTTSTTPGNLVSNRASVTLTTNTQAMVYLSGVCENTLQGQGAFLGVKVSGSSSVASNAYQGAIITFVEALATAGVQQTLAISYGATGATTADPPALTAGSNTFEAQLWVDGSSSAGASNVKLIVVPFN